MKSFAQKKEELTKLKDKLAKAKIVIFSSFAREGEKGLNVSDMGELKRGLKALDSEYLVEKKTLLDRALAQSPIDNRPRPTTGAVSGLGQSPINIFEYQGSLGVALGYGDGQVTAKTVYNFARKHPALKYFSAIWNGKFMDLTQFTEFAKLPAKDIMIARLLGMMKYPLSSLAVVLKQLSTKRETS